jgi:hypothetical protein
VCVYIYIYIYISYYAGLLPWQPGVKQQVASSIVRTGLKLLLSLLLNPVIYYCVFLLHVFSLSPHSHVYLKLHSERIILPLQLYFFNGHFFLNPSSGLRKLIIRLAADCHSLSNALHIRVTKDSTLQCQQILMKRPPKNAFSSMPWYRWLVAGLSSWKPGFHSRPGHMATFLGGLHASSVIITPSIHHTDLSITGAI